ncbi:MAG: hypothetical protein KME25_14990 [Symplocastrum torsivum CPER-KK1]|uniref:Uncharacterized protein n=1 Tax=Symplocastrum torsivum CPER-KK1 TaxID=450513 RepID=A0A951PLE2_9CYAN|nr:hypothetical protein [Symplocastrum torsivum CPER-KK1]
MALLSGEAIHSSKKQKAEGSISFIYNECEKCSWVAAKRNGADLSPERKYPTLREPLRGTGTLIFENASRTRTG